MIIYLRIQLSCYAVSFVSEKYRLIYNEKHIEVNNLVELFMLSFMSLMMTGLVLLGILKEDHYFRENEVYMNSILKKIIVSQLLSIMYSFIFVSVVTLSILLHKAEWFLLIGPIVLVAISYFVAHKSLLNKLVYYVLSILPFGIYVIVAFFGIGLSEIAIVQKDDYGIGLYLIFGILISWIMLILGSVLGNIDKL